MTVGKVSGDEHPRPETTPAALAALKPAFDGQGTVTAGNSSGINDGAAMLVICDEDRGRELGLKPLVIVTNSAGVGCEPSLMGLGPVHGTQRVWRDPGEFDLIEWNEAFAAQSLACMEELGFDETKVNGVVVARFRLDWRGNVYDSPSFYPE